MACWWGDPSCKVFSKAWMMLTGGDWTLVGGRYDFTYVASWRPNQELRFPSWL